MNTTADRFAPLKNKTQSVAVIGLGYVGLPLALCLAKHFRVIGFDINTNRINALKNKNDETNEVDATAFTNADITFTTDGNDLKNASFIIVAVPTPIDSAKRPDFTPLIGASTLVGRALRPGATVVFESTVYPGATEEVCLPVINRESNLTAGRDYFYGYSPERINPGDKERTVDKILKVVSGSDAETLDLVANVYGTAISAGVYRASSVKVAEAAKVIENTQRDLNIALVNEIALICHRLGIDTLEVLEAAGSKWNFLPFRPGLVGGHCIGVDPYYLTHKATELGYHPDVILAGRRINDGMGTWVAQECVRLLIDAGRPVKGARVLILGLTFKENISDVRNTKVIDIISELRRFGAIPVVCDPVADAAEAKREYGVELVAIDPLPQAEAVIIAVAHQQIRNITPTALVTATKQGPCLDLKGIFPISESRELGIAVWRI